MGSRIVASAVRSRVTLNHTSVVLLVFALALLVALTHGVLIARAQSIGWYLAPPGAVGSTPGCPESDRWLLLYWGGSSDTTIANAAESCVDARSFWGRRGAQWLGFQKHSPAASDIWMVSTGEAHFVLGRSGAQGQFWLDQQTLSSWNRPGAPLPAAPAPGGDPATTPRCAAVVKAPQTAEERAVTGAGWTLYASQTVIGRTAVVYGMASVDGMCRPWQYQAFAFRDGRFVGTFSPELMNARTDGSMVQVEQYPGDAAELVGAFNRYTDRDPLCCPSRKTFVAYRVLDAPGGSTLTPVLIRTEAISP